jgi:Flp pilus assembly protein CpaB
VRFRTWSVRSVLLPVLGVLLIVGSFLAVLGIGRYQARQVSVVVAVHDIPPLSPILPGDVALRPVPATAVPRTGVYRSVTPLIGQFVQYGIVAGDVVRPQMLLAMPAGSSPLDVQLREASQAAGMALEAVPLPLDQAAGFTLPHPGDRVSIVGVLNPPGGQGSGQMAKFVLRHALVLAVLAPGQQSTAVKATPFGGSAAVPTTGQAQATSGVLVLALPPTDAERLVLAEAAGKVTLVLDQLPQGQQAPGCAQRAGPAGPAPAGSACPADQTPAVTYGQLTDTGSGGALPASPAPYSAGSLPPVGGGR